MEGQYILEGHKPVKCGDLMKWGKWFGESNRHVAKDMIGKVRVSTVFLGLDHSFGGRKPLLFETMVFGGPLDQEQERYSTWEEAEKGHINMVRRVKESK